MNERIKQIIEYYGLNTSQFEKKIFSSNGSIRTVLNRGSSLNVSTVVRILENCPEISSDWLLLGKGKMLRQDSKKAPTKPYSTEENGTPMAAEQPVPYRTTPVHHAPLSDGCPWERYDAAQQEIGSLRERLARASVTIATLQQQLTTEREKTPSASATTDTVVTLV